MAVIEHLPSAMHLRLLRPQTGSRSRKTGFRMYERQKKGLPMPVLPIPMFIALLLLAFAVHRLVTRETHATLLILIGLCAAQSAIIALVQHYGFASLRPVQAITATLIPPAAWMAFSRATGGNGNSSGWVLFHAIGPALAIVCLLSDPTWLDVLIPLSFAGYGAGMLVRVGGSEDSLLHASLEHGATALWAWRVLALSLLASAGCDLLIAVTLAHGITGFLNWLPSIFSSLSLLSLGALALTHAIESRLDEAADESAQPTHDGELDKAIVARLNDYVARQKPFLDPELTLSRLARKVVIPAKQLSAAINRVTGENVSRFINRHRIEEVCSRLAAGQSVTTAMLESGFNTKSNFNREFQRVKGMSPSQWLDANKALVDTE
jgi:AraC-like DNA-binding protein